MCWEDEGEHEQQPQPSLSRLRGVQAAQLLQDLAAAQRVLHVANQVLDGLAIDHHAGDAFEKLLDGAVIKVRHDRSSELLQNLILEDEMFKLLIVLESKILYR
jgi:hypothetical protein